MLFSKNFLIGSLIVVLGLLGLWGLASSIGLIGKRAPAEESKDNAESATDSDEEPDGKMADSYESLNTNVGGKETPIAVEAAPVQLGTLIERVNTQGRVYAYQATDITNEIGGRLLKLHFRDGDWVKKGQLLAEIDDRSYLVEMVDAEARYLSAQADLAAQNIGAERYGIAPTDHGDALAELDRQYKEKLLSKNDYEQKKRQLELFSGSRREEVLSAKWVATAKAALDRAKLNLEKCRIVAPFDGEIFGIAVSVGQVLAPSIKFARVVNLDDLVIRANVLESEIGEIRVDRAATATFTALPDLEQVAGSVKAVSPFVNEENKTVETIIRIQNVDHRIRPGMFAEVRIDARIHENKLMVPKEAILPRDNRKVIFKVSPEGRAKWIYVETGVENNEMVEIMPGKIEPGDMVLTDNHYTMGHDTLVTIGGKKTD